MVCDASVEATSAAAEPELERATNGEDSASSKTDAKYEVTSTEVSSISSKRSTKGRRFFGLTGSEWITVILLSNSTFWCYTALSHLAPFFPREAAARGLVQSKIGIVHGSFAFTAFITSPFYGRYMSVLGVRRTYLLGLASTSISSLAFGALTWMPSGWPFFFGALFMRSIQAIGDAAVVTATFALGSACFPQHVTLIVSVLEVFVGLGAMAGPMIGGFFFEIGGFPLPFLVIGTVLGVSVPLSIVFIPAPPEDREKRDVPQQSALRLAKVPVMWALFCATVVGALSMHYLSQGLSRHLQTMGVSPTKVGFLFLISGGAYSITSPLLGFAIDRLHCEKAILLFGSSITIVAMLIVGPSPLVPFEGHLVLVGIALCCLGIATGAQYLPVFQLTLTNAKKRGFPDDATTVGLVAGIMQSGWSLGAFIGPAAGGISMQLLGFPWASTCFAFVHVLFIITFLSLLVVHYVTHRGVRHSGSESEEGAPKASMLV